MNLDKSLSRENFFYQIEETYPLAMKLFYRWIDEYKEAINWNKLFSESYHRKKSFNEKDVEWIFSTPKFYDLPYAMQNGIWLEFCRQILHKYFEQPEHISDSIDLEEDIRLTLGALEPILKED